MEAAGGEMKITTERLKELMNKRYNPGECDYCGSESDNLESFVLCSYSSGGLMPTTTYYLCEFCAELSLKKLMEV